ncbi:unnamed protein product [Meloidogyne enterolobii]|uniref:Uncharacterized protein n=1 Tax=Meloidogyne enterolobii TaxID=390850 RepID=A0ACB0Y298_MELEN
MIIFLLLITQLQLTNAMFHQEGEISSSRGKQVQMHSSPQPSTESGIHFSLVELSILIRVLRFIDIETIKGFTDPTIDLKNIIEWYCDNDFNTLQMDNKDSIGRIYVQLKTKLTQVDSIRIFNKF